MSKLSNEGQKGEDFNTHDFNIGCLWQPMCLGSYSYPGFLLKTVSPNAS